MKVNTVNVQSELISGTNIKTINNTSLLGSGDITISSGSSGLHVSVAPISGRIYAPIMSGTGGTTSITGANRITLIPFLPLNNLRAGSFSINVTVAAAGSLAKVLVFSNVSGGPSVKLFESTDLNCATTGIKTVTANNYTFAAGTTYWVGIISNQAGATYSAFSATSMIPISISGVGNSSNYFLNSSSYTFASVPSTVDNALFGPASANCAGLWITAA